jgi:hypothetical protein
MWNKLKGIRGQLVFLTLIPVIGILILVYRADRVVDQLEASVETANLVRAPLIVHTGVMAKEVAVLQRWMKVAVADPDLVRSLLGREKVQTAVLAFDEALAAYQKLPRGTRTAAAFTLVENNWQALRGKTVQVVSLLENGSREDANMIFESQLDKLSETLEGNLTELSDLRLAAMSDDVAADHALVAESKSTLILIGLGILAIIILTCAWIGTRITKTLQMSVENLTGASEELASASEQLTASSEGVAEASTAGAAAIEECVASLEEITAMVKINADNGRKAAELAQGATLKATQGEQEINELIHAIQAIAASSEKITQIISVIDDIAFQTNLLSLNASVEAARAGEHGRGFSVVAEAVRTLAQKSAHSSQEIGTLLRTSLEQIKKGASIADRSGVVFKEISSAIQMVAEVNSDVASASREQEAGVAQMTKAMNELDGTTQNNAASSEEVAASAQELTAQALSLQDIITGLRGILNGKASTVLTPKNEQISSRKFTEGSIIPSILSGRTH